MLDNKFSNIYLTTLASYMLARIQMGSSFSSQEERSKLVAVLRISQTTCRRVFNGYVEGACEEAAGLSWKDVQSNGALSDLHEQIAKPITNMKMSAYCGSLDPQLTHQIVEDFEGLADHKEDLIKVQKQNREMAEKRRNKSAS